LFPHALFTLVDEDGDPTPRRRAIASVAVAHSGRWRCAATPETKKKRKTFAFAVGLLLHRNKWETGTTFFFVTVAFRPKGVVHYTRAHTQTTHNGVVPISSFSIQ
jgi:hypothetical protein